MQDLGSSSPKLSSPEAGSGSPQPSAQLDAEQMRGKVVLEIYETEQVYHKLLAEFIDVYLRELESGDNEQARAFMSRPNLAGLCSNIEQISHISQQLSRELHKALDEAGAFEPNLAPGVIARRAARAPVGPVFQRCASLLQLYEQYVENHAFAKSDIQGFLDKTKSFQVFWKKCGDDARAARHAAQVQAQNNAALGLATSNNLRMKRQSSADYATSLNSIFSTTSLDGYLILPVQRVPRYKLFLEQLIRVTEKIGKDEMRGETTTPPGSPLASLDSPRAQSKLNRSAGGPSLSKFYATEMVELQLAYKSVAEAASRMNEAIRGSETNQQMRLLQSKFKGESVDLVGAGRVSRTLIREGELMRVTQKSRRHKPFYFHLLSDMILYSELSANGTYKLHRMIPLDGSCKVFANINTPSGSQYEQYSQDHGEEPAASGLSASARRRSSIKIPSRRKSEQPSSPPPPTSRSSDGAGYGPGNPRDAETGDSQGGGVSSSTNRAFEVASHSKTITMYAATMAEKEAWVRDIKAVIRELARTQAPNTPPSNSTLFSAEENSLECQICGTQFSLVRRKHHCRRCGVVTCGDCCNRKRYLTSSKGIVPQKCCDVCRLEMDLTAWDEQPYRFRLFVQIRSIDRLGELARGGDDRTRKDPLSRCYFALTQRSVKGGGIPGMKRGPTTVGNEASFKIPVGPRIDQEDSPYWVLRVYLVSLGEIGTVTLDMRDIMCDQTMVHRNRTTASYTLRGPVVDEMCETPPIVVLKFELSMPPALWVKPHMEDAIAKETQLLRKYLEANPSATSPATPSTGNNTPAGSPTTPTPSADQQPSGASTEEEASSVKRSRSASERSSLARQSGGGVNGKTQDPERGSDNEEEERKAREKFSVDARSARYEDDEDEDEEDDEGGDGGGSSGTMMKRSSTGGIEFMSTNSAPRLAREQSADSSTQGSFRRRGGAAGSNNSKNLSKRPRGRLNVQVYTMYEKIARERPSHWTVQCVHYLYTDTAVRLANETSGVLSKEALATLMDRFAKFDNNPTIRKALEAAENQPSAASTNQFSLGSNKKDGSSEARRSLMGSTNGQTNVNQPGAAFISQRALNHFELAVRPLSISAKASSTPEEKRLGFSNGFGGSQLYLGASVTDGESAHPRCLVLADLLRTERLYIKALEDLDEVFVGPLMQVAHGASAQTVKASVRESRGGNAAPHLLPGAGPLIASIRQRRDAQESRAVASAVKQPDVTVLLQSVRQILTINKQLLRDLDLRLSTINVSKCIGDIFCRFAVVLKVYNAYATNFPSVEKVLTPRDVPLLALSSAKGSTNPMTRGDNTNGSGGNHNANGGDDDDSGEGPNEALINFVRVLEEDERCNGRSFVQFLRLPKERLNRYKRILTSLLMHTPDDHDDAQLLRDSLKLLDQSEKHISWSLRRRFNLEKLQDIQRCFSKVLPLGKQAPQLVSARRWFKKEGYLVKRCRRDDKLVRFWLFNDALVYGVRVAGVTAKSAPSFRFSRFLMLKDMTVHDLERGVAKRTNKEGEYHQELGDNKLAFEIRSPEKSFIVMVPLILYDRPFTSAQPPVPNLGVPSNNTSTSPNLNALPTNPHLSSSPVSPQSASAAGGVNELASEEMRKKIKDDWLNEILQCIHDIHEDEEIAPEDKRGGGETTDSLFKKTASHNRKVDAKAAPVWVHDQASNTCSQCPNKFTLTFRRHHCRSCGALVCEACSKAREVLENIHPTKKQRVCKRCVAEMHEEEDTA